MTPLLAALTSRFPALRKLPPGCYVVGGAIRDLLLAREPLDVDVAAPDAATAAAVVLGPWLANLKVRPAFDLLPLAVLLSLGVALLGSWIPARLASRIEPFASMQEV